MEKKKTSSKDNLGDRMKGYENITRYHLMPRSYVFLRVDGRAFHTYTKKLVKPFDVNLHQDMDATAKYLCENIQNAKLGYVQSDEITILLTGFDDINTQQFFDGNIQKITSIVSSLATARFNQLRFSRITREYKSPLWDMNIPLATFDCRCWNIPTQTEAMNTFIWRNQDCTRNSISMMAQFYFSHKELQGKSSKDMLEMLKEKSDWEKIYESLKYGRIILKEDYLESIKNQLVEKNHWVVRSAWKFTENKEKLIEMIPQYL